MSNDNAALQQVLAMLRDDDGGMAKTAERADESVSADDVYYELGKQAWVDMYRDAHVKHADAQVEDGLAKVSHLLLKVANRQGIVPGIVKQACPNDPDLQAVLLGVLEQAANA